MIGKYFNSLADALAVKSQSASLTQHGPDTGTNREHLLIDLLDRHLPDRLKALNGGCILNLDGQRSRQIDIIVKNDLFPKFEEHDKSFVIAESVAGVIAVKSKLDKKELEDAIENVASVPGFTSKTLSLTNTSIVRAGLDEQFRDNWPFRAVFAFDGIDTDTLYNHMVTYFNKHPDRRSRFPTIVVVNNQTCIRYLRDGGKLNDGRDLPPNSLRPLRLTDATKGYPIAGLVTELNNYVPWMHYMKFNFSPYIDKAYCG